MKLGRISSLALNRMKRRGIPLATLRYLLAHGRVERKQDGARLVYMEEFPHPAGPRLWGTLYAVLDATGEVILVDRRIRREGAPSTRTNRAALS